MDTTFPADLAAQVDKVLAICRAQMTEGAVAAVTYVIDSRTGTMVPVEMHMPNEVSKDISAAMVRWTAKNMKADATIMVNEAWTLSREDLQRHAEIIARYGSIRDYPGKLDVLMVQVQTRAGHWLGRAPIEHAGDARRCGPMEVIRGDAAAGTLTNFLPPEELP